MPGPIAHTFYAHRAFQLRFPGINLRAFLIGTHLPDIRNLSGHPREHTHRRDITMAEVAEAHDVFEMGYRLHSYVDALHWRVLRDAGVTHAYYRDRTYSTAWKMVAEEMLYPKMPDMKPVVGFLEDILEDELRYGIEEPHVEQWHEMLGEYFTHVPNEKNMTERLSALGVASDRADVITKRAYTFREDPALPEYLNQAVEHFDRELAVV